jgi:4'-phosphopantetheinyl transferase EntD
MDQGVDIPQPSGPQWDRLLFSAKEVSSSLGSPFTGQWLGFEDAEVLIDPLLEVSVARLRVPGPEVDGQELALSRGVGWRADMILTATAVQYGQSRTGRRDAA